VFIASDSVGDNARSRTRIRIVAITTRPAPNRMTSLPTWRLASCRDWLTSSVQPTTSALPEPQRAWRAMTPRPDEVGPYVLGGRGVSVEPPRLELAAGGGAVTLRIPRSCRASQDTSYTGKPAKGRGLP
jgi:hypothetical protein